MMQTAALSTQVCVIYRSRDGVIVHTHVEAFPADRAPHTEQEMERRAFHHASAKRRALDDVKCVHLRDPQVSGIAKRVDPQTGEIEFVELNALGTSPGKRSGDV
jgi:hypothetical protein